MSSNVRLAVLAFAAIVIGVIGGMVANHKSSYQEVYVKLGQSLQVSVYPDLGQSSSDKIYNFNSSAAPVSVITKSGFVKLKNGTYDFVIKDPDHQYENPITKVIVGGLTGTVDINPVYSTQKLNSMLQSERPTIQQALVSRYPSFTASYKIANDELYEHGDWYGASLTPNSPDVDKLVVIMHEVSGKWVVAASPQISIGMPSNPSIPSEVVDNTDQL